MCYHLGNKEKEEPLFSCLHMLSFGAKDPHARWFSGVAGCYVGLSAGNLSGLLCKPSQSAAWLNHGLIIMLQAGEKGCHSSSIEALNWQYFILPLQVVTGLCNSQWLRKNKTPPLHGGVARDLTNNFQASHIMHGDQWSHSSAIKVSYSKNQI